MKKNKITYWIITSLVSLSLLMAGIMYLTNPEVAAGFTHLGFPGYFRIELGIAKIIGAVLLILPAVPRNVKDWVYAGAGITYISAAIAHASSGDPVSAVVSPIVTLVLLTVSYYCYVKLPGSITPVPTI